MDKIIFFHMNQLGDLLFSLPVLQTVRKQYPGIKIYSVVKANLAGLLKSTGLVDKIFIKEKSFVKRLKLIKEIKNENIKTAILFSESPETLITAFLSNIQTRFGFKTSSLGFLLTHKADKQGVPSLSNNIRLAQLAGIKDIKDDYVDLIPVDTNADATVSQWLVSKDIRKKEFIIISAGASPKRRNKCLRKDVWIETIDRLTEKNTKVVVVCAKWEKEYVQNILDKCANKAELFIPKEGLTELAALIQQSKLFVGIDSGVMHLSASLKIKCIALFGSTDPCQIGPQPLSSHVIIKKKNINNIDSDDIINALNQYL